MSLEERSRESRPVPAERGAARITRGASRLHCWSPSAARRVRSSAFLPVALALCLLTGASAAAGAVGARSTAPTQVAQPSSDRGADTSSMFAARQLAGGQVATNRGNNSRDGWYPNQPGLSPQAVGSSGFGQLFATQLNGQIYAQPLLVGNVLFVATETDWVYGLSPVTGVIEWSRQIGTPFRDAPLHCGDLVPYLGVTSTPTVDPTTGVVYLVDQAYLSGAAGPVGWFMHAINPASGAEMPHFPVEIKGPVSNNPQQRFTPTQELQRPGLLFLGGVVYAAFGSHCDYPPYSGLVVGVSASGRQTTMWSVEGAGNASGGGIWQGGGGLVSVGPGQILFVSGNGLNSDASHPNGHIPGHRSAGWFIEGEELLLDVRRCPRRQT